MSNIYKPGTGGGGSGIIETIAGDSGSITGANVTIFANRATANAGASVGFDNTGTTSTLNLTDSLNNTFLGRTAGNSTLSGSGNIGIGIAACQNITTANNNICIGFQAGISIEPGDRNIAIGDNTLATAVNADQCIALGSEALMTCDQDGIIGIGAGALKTLSTGTGNIAIGVNALTLSNGSNNICVGQSSFASSLVANNNTAIGFTSGSGNTGGANTVMGSLALASAGTAENSTLVGYQAGNAITNGNNNTAVGFGALNQILTGSNNTAIGYLAGSALNGLEDGNVYVSSVGVAGDSGTIRIGDGGNQGTVYIQGIWNTDFIDNQQVIVNSAGQLGSQPNSLQNYTSPLLDFTAAGNTAIFVNNRSTSFVITNILFLAGTIAGVAAGATCDLGWTAPTYNDFRTGLINTLSVSGTYLTSLIDATTTQPPVPSGETFQINITTPDGTATTNNGFIILQGFYL